MPASDYNMKEIAAGRLTGEHVETLTRYFQRGQSIPVDGYAGPNTRAVLDNYDEKADKDATQEGPQPPDVGGWKYWDGPSMHQPRNRQEIYKFLGDPGTGKEDRAWHRENIVGIKIPGVKEGRWLHRKLWVHRVVAPYLLEAIRRVRIVRPDFDFNVVAVHAFRHQQHDPKKPLSVHSWGAAVDFNPKENFTRKYKRGEGPKGFSERYNSIWKPGPRVVDQKFVDAMASCGFAWGSDWDEDGMTDDHTFYDPMHFEWVARDGRNWMV